ncbi:MAG: hypothetical protein OSJ76_01165 [Alphaproteobacteria bacterium]|nr:hypothetical protein [Alphaproteobacteria bacterium]
MPTVSQIEKGLQENRRVEKIINVVIPTLSYFYGKPKWLTDPKEDQNPMEIMRNWATELGGYSEHQLKNACYRVHRFKKSQTFPEIPHIREQLTEEIPEDEDFYQKNYQDEVNGGFNIENWLMEIDGGEEFKHLKFLRPDYCALVRFVCDERLPEKIGYSEWEKLNYKERFGETGIKFKTAWENGLFDDREQILPLIKMRRMGNEVFIPLLPVEQRLNNGEFEF